MAKSQAQWIWYLATARSIQMEALRLLARSVDTGFPAGRGGGLRRDFRTNRFRVLHGLYELFGSARVFTLASVIAGQLDWSIPLLQRQQDPHFRDTSL